MSNRFTLSSLMLVLIFQSSLVNAETSWWQPDWLSAGGWQNDAPLPKIQVAEAFVEWRTGPAQGYPVFHSSERGEWLTILKRKTDWMKVRDEKGREGWLSIEDVLLTKDGSGERVSLNEPRFDDFNTRRWEAGLMMGEFESTAVNAAYVGYWFTENISTELWGSQVLGNASEILLLDLNILHQPFPDWRLSPFFTLGVGQIYVEPKATLVQAEDREDTTANVGLGMRYYVTDRFFIRADMKDYKVFTNRESNEEATEWKIGLSVFF